MSDQQTTAGVHPIAIAGVVLAGIAIIIATAGYDWAWIVGGIAALVSIAGLVFTRTTGKWTRALALLGIIGGIIAIVLSLL